MDRRWRRGKRAGGSQCGCVAFTPLGNRSSFITDLPVSRDTATELAACGLARWKIENETFNVLNHHAPTADQSPAATPSRRGSAAPTSPSGVTAMIPSPLISL